MAANETGGETATNEPNRDGKLFWFNVWSEDSADVVGRARHSRAIVDLAAIAARAATRTVQTA